MANQDAPFGLRPIGKVGSNRDAQGNTEYEIAACASAMYQNDCVKASGAGIAIAAATDNGALLGALTGVFFTDSTTSKPTFANNLKASNAATDIKGFVTDDPFQLYEIQSNNSGASAQGDIGLNADLSVVAGASPHYVSKTELDDDGSPAIAATTLNLRIMNVSDDPENSDLTAANVNWKVIITEHFLMTTTGQ
jgi:hypothetical protein